MRDDGRIFHDDVLFFMAFEAFAESIFVLRVMASRTSLERGHCYGFFAEGMAGIAGYFFLDMGLVGKIAFDLIRIAGS